MKQEVKIGQQDYTVLVFIPDSASTDGSGKTGLVAANLTVSGTRVETDNDVTVTDYTASLNNLAALTTAHTDWGVLEVSSTLAPGLYRLDIADAIFATGAWSAVVYVMVTTSAAAASPMEFVLIPQSPIDGVLLAPTTHTSAVIPTVTTTTTATNVTTVNGLAANVITAASMNADASGEIADAVWDEDATGHQTGGTFGQAIGDPGADTNTIFKAVVTDATGVTVGADTTTLLGDTATLYTQITESFVFLFEDVLGAPSDFGSGATIAKNLVDIESQTDDIGVAGAGLTVLATQASVNTIDDFLDTEIAAIITSIDALPTNAELATALATADDAVLAAIAALNNLSASQVNAEVVDALATDTYAEPGQATPAATTTLALKIGYLYKAFRNRHTQTATEYSLYNDDTTTVGQKAAVSDNGTTFDRGEVATGP